MLENITVQGVCDLIIIIGTAYFMIVKIIDSWAKPTSKLKQKKKEKSNFELRAVLDDVMPKYLEEHDLKTREKYKADRERYLHEIEAEVLHDTESTLEEIRKINADQSTQLKLLNELMEKLHQGQRDILRQKLMAIYTRHKNDRLLSYDEKDDIDALYKDYKAINGNSYIDRVYNRMTTWNVQPDDYTESKEVKI